MQPDSKTLTDLVLDVASQPAKFNLFKRLKTGVRPAYTFAIAHKLAAQCQLPASLLAAQIVEVLIQSQRQSASALGTVWKQLPIPEAALPELKIQAMATGLIQVELGDRAIATWLDMLIHSPTSYLLPSHSQPSFPKTFPRSIFAAQHTHARCCSLLRLAHSEGLIMLAQEIHPTFWHFIKPTKFSWLDSNESLGLNHPTEHRLILQLFVVIDELYNQPWNYFEKNRLRLVEGVCWAFAQFHRERQLFGKVESQTLVLRQAQLGLMLATQRLLHHLLENYLNVSAPTEL